MTDETSQLSDVIDSFEPLFKSLPAVSERDWQLLDQALETAKIMLGPQARVHSVGELIDEALEDAPAGFDGDDFLMFLALLGSNAMQEHVATLPEEVQRHIGDLAVKNEIWAEYILRHLTPKTQLDWTIVHGARVVVGSEKPKLRLIISRRDGVDLVLETGPRGALKLARNIIRRIHAELPEDLGSVREKDLDEVHESLRAIELAIRADEE